MTLPYHNVIWMKYRLNDIAMLQCHIDENHLQWHWHFTMSYGWDTGSMTLPFYNLWKPPSMTLAVYNVIVMTTTLKDIGILQCHVNNVCPLCTHQIMSNDTLSVQQFSLISVHIMVWPCHTLTLNVMSTFLCHQVHMETWHFAPPDATEQKEMPTARP